MPENATPRRHRAARGAGRSRPRPGGRLGSSSSTATTNAPTRGRRSGRSNGSSTTRRRRSLRLPAFPAHRDPPPRPGGGGLRRGSRAPGPVLGHARAALHRQQALEDDDLRRYAAQLGLDVARFDHDRAGAAVLRRDPPRRRERTGIGRGARHADPVHRRRRAPRRLRRGHPAGGIGPMSAICSHTDSITADRAAGRDRRLRRLPGDRRKMGAPADVPVLRPHRLLRQLAAPARLPLMPAAQGTRSSAPPNPVSTGAGATSTTSRSWSADHDAPPELHLADWRPTKDTLHLYARSSARSGSPPPHRATTGGTSRSTSTSAASRHGACIIAGRPSRSRRLRRSRPRRADRRRAQPVVRARRRGAGRRLRRPPPRDARRARHRRRDQGGAVRRADDDAVSPGLEHASWDREPSSASAASSTGPTPCSRSSAAGSTARPARCTSSGTASTSPSPASPAARRRDRRRPGQPRGLLARGHLVRFLGRRRHRRRRHLLLLHRARARRTPRPAAAAGGWIEYGAGSLAVLPYETVRTARDPRTTLLAFCQSAYEAGARLAGWDTSSFESRWCPSPAQLRQLHTTAAADFGRPSAST